MRNKIFPITALSIPKNILGIESKGLGDRRIVVLSLDRKSHNPLQIAKTLFRNPLTLTPENDFKNKKYIH